MMKNLLLAVFLLNILTFWISACTSAQTNTSKEIEEGVEEMKDERDGEIYEVVKIGDKTWLAENLRYKAEGSVVNPQNPSPIYGRLYNLMAAQTACPNGWHLASNKEWNDLEVAHGIPIEEASKGGWRGIHGTNMKTTKGWEENGNGTNSLGFNVLPAGYYFSGWGGTKEGLEGLGYSAAFWSSMEDSTASARFLFSPRKWVNRWEDKNNETGAKLSCRCVKD